MQEYDDTGYRPCIGCGRKTPRVMSRGHQCGKCGAEEVMETGSRLQRAALHLGGKVWDKDTDGPRVYVSFENLVDINITVNGEPVEISVLRWMLNQRIYVGADDQVHAGATNNTEIAAWTMAALEANA